MTDQIPQLCPVCAGLKLLWKPKREGDPISGHIKCPNCDAAGLVMIAKPDLHKHMGDTIAASLTAMGHDPQNPDPVKIAAAVTHCLNGQEFAKRIVNSVDKPNAAA